VGQWIKYRDNGTLMRKPSLQHLFGKGSTPMDKYYIEFDSESNPGKIETITVSLGLETVSDMKKSLPINLCDHPLYGRLVEYVKNNPAT
jgi:hypothetical protein